jgi:hypothetical protein
VPADPAARDREAELLTVRPVTLASVEVESGRPEPANGELLEEVAGGEDPERAALEFGAFVLGRLGVLNWSARSQGTPSREPPK